VDSAAPGIGARRGEEALPSELEARIAELETEPIGADFDRMSWFWMMLFGVVLPAVLWVAGFNA
jgi:hypothetical protein